VTKLLKKNLEQKDKKTHHRGTEDTERARKLESQKAGKLEDEKVRI